MVDIKNQNNSIKICVSTSNGRKEILAGGDSSAYYSSLSKSWANKLGDTVDGSEYSSKYYALYSKECSEISKKAKDNILENRGFQIVVEDLTGDNSIKLCAENLNSIQSAASNAQIASEKAALAIEQAEIATQKAEEAHDILEGSANVDLANITDNGKSVIQQYGGVWGSITGNVENQTDLQTVLDNKVNLNLDNCTKPYVTETYINGASWYRIWSDGWCEQGGYSDAGQNVTLLKSYKDTNYSLIMGLDAYTGNTPTFAAIGYTNKTVTGFTFTIYQGSPGDWETKGYINEGD